MRKVGGERQEKKDYIEFRRPAKIQSRLPKFWGIRRSGRGSKSRHAWDESLNGAPRKKTLRPYRGAQKVVGVRSWIGGGAKEGALDDQRIAHNGGLKERMNKERGVGT